MPFYMPNMLWQSGIYLHKIKSIQHELSLFSIQYFEVNTLTLPKLSLAMGSTQLFCSEKNVNGEVSRQHIWLSTLNKSTSRWLTHKALCFFLSLRRCGGDRGRYKAGVFLKSNGKRRRQFKSNAVLKWE